MDSQNTWILYEILRALIEQMSELKGFFLIYAVKTSTKNLNFLSTELDVEELFPIDSVYYYYQDRNHTNIIDSYIYQATITKDYKIILFPFLLTRSCYDENDN